MYKTEKLYQLYLTESELLDIEQAIYDKAGILYLISQEMTNRKDETKAQKASSRSVYFEVLASKVGYPLDELYKAKTQPTIKEENK